LSLNLGLRWEILGGINEANGQTTTMNPLLPNTAAGNLPGALQFASQLKKKGFENTNWGLILPRFGVTYQVNPKVSGGRDSALIRRLPKLVRSFNLVDRLHVWL